MTSSLPRCAICQQPVRLETAKSDERGQPVHEDCYLQRLMASLQYPPPPHHAQ
jgi:hypothetical protein